MKSKNLKSAYSFSIFVGMIAGLALPICFSAILGEPISQRMAEVVASASIPVFYLLGNILHTSCIPFAILLLMGYWEIVGIGVSCSLVWLCSFILRKRRRVAD
jgi:hypothetical protein